MNGILRWLTVKTIRAQIPNTLTMSRLFLGLVFPILPESWWIMALAWGSISEFLDGFLSRKMHTVSAFGTFMDPVADKVFVLAAALTFLSAGFIALPELLLVAVRDIFVALSSLVVLVRGKDTSYHDLLPSPLGKLTTTLQLITLFSLPLLERSESILIYLTGLISMLAAMDYARRFLQRTPNCPNSPRKGTKSHF